jgi:prepilin-type N-terminal cleavage/methylation domain-containing protein
MEAMRSKGRRQRGFSLVEVLVAMGLLAFVAIGILPLLMRCVSDNRRGWEATQASHFVQSELEPMLAHPFDNPALALEPGTLERRSAAAWVEGDAGKVGDGREGWTDRPAGKGRSFWRRATTVRWYDVGDLEAPLDGDAEPVHLKEIRVHLAGVRQGGALGAGQVLHVRVLRAF